MYVHHLVTGSPADECGCINIGDRILETNGYDIRYSTLDQAATIMAVSYNKILNGNLMCINCMMFK